MNREEFVELLGKIRSNISDEDYEIAVSWSLIFKKYRFYIKPKNGWYKVCAEKGFRTKTLYLEKIR